VGYAFALTIPELAVALVVLEVVDVLLFRRRGQRLLGFRGSGQRAAPVAYDEVAAFLTPAKRVELEERQSRSLVRDTVEDGAGSRTRVDLDAGRVVLARGVRRPAG
jgi:hypothetical protein